MPRFNFLLCSSVLLFCLSTVEGQATKCYSCLDKAPGAPSSEEPACAKPRELDCQESLLESFSLVTPQIFLKLNFKFEDLWGTPKYKCMLKTQKSTHLQTRGCILAQVDQIPVCANAGKNFTCTVCDTDLCNAQKDASRNLKIKPKK